MTIYEHLRQRVRFLSFAPLVFAAVPLCLVGGCAGHKQTMTTKEKPVRIACVGDSITYGAGIEGRESNCYPAVLGRLLGSNYQTENFGVNGATFLKKGDHPYWNQKEFQAVADFAPAVVIIKLGTNDSKPQNWRFKQEFASDMRAMINHFRNLPGHPKVWICTPVPVYATIGGISEAVVGGEIVPLVRNTARAEQVPVIETYVALSNHPEAFPDGVHPNAAGAAQLAQAVAVSIKRFHGF